MFGLDQNQLVPRTKVLQDVDDLDVEALRLRPFEHRQAVTLHASLQVFHGENVGTAHDPVGVGRPLAEEGKRKQEAGEQRTR